MPPSSAYLLVAHGSRDSRPQLALQKLAELVEVRLGHDVNRAAIKVATTEGFSGDIDGQCITAESLSQVEPLLVKTATLELAPIPLHEQIYQFAAQVLAVGGNRIQVLPLFLLPGVHVMEDIPQEVAVAQRCLGKAVILDQQPHLGSHPRLIHLLVNQEAIAESETKILLSHGTRRPSGNQPVERIAKQLGAVVAYWSMQPTLAEQVKGLANAGYQQIGILPYFLFAGGLTDAIAQTVADLQTQFPQLQLKLGEPIGATPQLAELIVELTQPLGGENR